MAAKDFFLFFEVAIFNRHQWVFPGGKAVGCQANAEVQHSHLFFHK